MRFLKKLFVRLDQALVDELIAIYEKNPKGFHSDMGASQARSRVVRIGMTLNEQGGMKLMKKAHAEFAHRNRVPGASRNLEHTWDLIGDWRG